MVPGLEFAMPGLYGFDFEKTCLGRNVRMIPEPCPALRLRLVPFVRAEPSCLFPPSQVVFEGIRGPGYEGDIAIDDVSITIGKCKQENTVASAGKTGKIFTVDCRDILSRKRT